MKKNFKKLSSLALAFVLVFALSVSALAADISADKAKEIALADAGYKASDVVNLIAVTDYDNGTKYYDVSFFVVQADGGYLEYDYEIGAANGNIYDRDVEREGAKASNTRPQENSGADIGIDAAKEVALAYFGVAEGDVKVLEARKDYDDGVAVYEFEFAKGYDFRYSCEVVASNGRVTDAEKEAVRSLGDKIELFFEILFATLFNR